MLNHTEIEIVVAVLLGIHGFAQVIVFKLLHFLGLTMAHLCPKPTKKQQK